MPVPVASKNWRVTSTPGSHHGIDIAVASGTAAIATVDGVVERATSVRDASGRLVSYGHYVVIRDAQGNRHYYAHLSGFAVQAGQRVSAGAVIGYTGNTGNSTGPHLHYEVRGPGGAQVNPASYVGGDVIDAPSMEDYQTSGYIASIIGSAPDAYASTISTSRRWIKRFYDDIRDVVSEDLGVIETPEPEEQEDAGLLPNA